MLITSLWVFAKVGLLTIGGGLAMIPLLQDEIVTRGWITIDEFTHMISISQMTPGPIIVNLATFVGFRLNGVPGAIACTLGVILPSLVIVTLISSVLFKYRNSDFVSRLFAVVRPVVVGLIAGAGVGLAQQALLDVNDGAATQLQGSGLAAIQVDWTASLIFAVSMVLLSKTELHPAKVLATGALLGSVLFTVLA